MTPEERQRSGQAVADRIKELHTSAAAVARRAGIDAKAIRGLMNGSRWPTYETRRRIETALHWPPGEVGRRSGKGNRLAGFRSTELLRELCRRAEAYEASQERDS